MKNKTNNKFIIGLLIFTILACAGIFLYPSFYDYQCRNRVYEEFEPMIVDIKSSSIVIISIQEHDDIKSYSSGSSGVIFDKHGNTYYALTAKHVINQEHCTFKAYTIETPNYDEYRKDKNSEGNYSHIPNEEYYAIMSDINIEYVSGDADLAIVSFSTNDDLMVSPVAENIPHKKDRIVLVSNPEGDKFTVTFGQIKSNLTKFKAAGEGDEDSDWVLMHSAYEAPGSSGSGTFNNNGEIIGINIGGGTDAFGRFKYGVLIPCDQVRTCISNWQAGR